MSKRVMSDDSMSLGGRAFSRVKDNMEWRDGEVVTPLGIVTAYQEDGYARLDFVSGGRLHMRSFRGPQMTRMGLVRAAVKFAREISS